MNVICLVQQGSTPTTTRQRLESGLTELVQRELPLIGKPTFSWMEVAEGCGFTAGEPSKAAIAAATLPAGTAKEVRVRFLSGVCDLWTRETGCTLDDIVASAFDDDAPM